MTYEATDADLDAIFKERLIPESTADYVRRLTKERNEARASLQAESDNADREHARADALAAKLARVETVLADMDERGRPGDSDSASDTTSRRQIREDVRRVRAALADADATAASPSGLDVDPAAERPNARPLRSSDTPATTEACSRGICSADEGHEGTCTEASGWADEDDWVGDQRDAMSVQTDGGAL